MLSHDLASFGLDAKGLEEEATKEYRRRVLASKLLNDPFLFFKHVITPKELRNEIGSLHQEGLDFVQGGRRKKLILWPRGHLKTAVFTQSETLRRAILNPNIRILLSTAKWDNSKRFLNAIKGHLQNPEFIELFGDLMPANRDVGFKNNEAELTLSARTNMSLREPTFSTTGLDKIQTSQHYDLIVHDDVVARDNITSTEMMDKVILYYRDSLDLLDPGKDLWIIGTRWHPLDLYGWVMDGLCDSRCKDNNWVHVGECDCTFDVSFKVVETENKFIFPQRFNEKYLKELVKEKDQFEVASQYYNNPSDQSNCWFKFPQVRKSLRPAREIAEISKDLTWFVAVDPAESTQSRSSFTACVAVGVDFKTGKWYVDHAKRARVEPPGFINLCLEAYRKYRPIKFGMELHTRKALKFVLETAMLEQKVMFPIEELKPPMQGTGGKGKEMRIQRLLPLFEREMIYINEDLKDLVNELYTIPSATSWDLSDALSYMLDMIPIGVGQEEQFTPPERYVHWKGLGY